MTPLSGLGVWIYELRNCEGGDVAKILARCATARVKWVAIDVRNGIAPSVVQGFRDAGVECAAWFYSVPGVIETAHQIALVKRLVAQGYLHILIDAETEWESIKNDAGVRVPASRRAEAGPFAQALRAAVGPDVFLGDAPWPIVSSHAGFPWAEFGAVVDARMDQSYWRLGEKPAAKFLDWADREWAKMPATPPRCPIGCNVDYTGSKHGDPSEIRVFLERYQDRPALSLWSWQHLNAAEWAVIEAWSATRLPTLEQALETAPADPPASGPAA